MRCYAENGGEAVLKHNTVERLRNKIGGEKNESNWGIARRLRGNILA